MKDWKNHVWTGSAINLGQIFHDIVCPGLIPKHTINERTLIIFEQVGVPGQFCTYVDDLCRTRTSVIFTATRHRMHEGDTPIAARIYHTTV